MNTTYEVIPCPNLTHGVQAYVDGEAQGVDAHWLSRAAADRAKRAYDDGRAVHGDWASIRDALTREGVVL